MRVSLTENQARLVLNQILGTPESNYSDRVPKNSTDLLLTPWSDFSLKSLGVTALQDAGLAIIRGED